MASKTISTINIAINANSKGVQRGLEAANKSMDDFRRRSLRMSEMYANITTGITQAIGVAREFAGYMRSVAEAVLELASAAEELDRVADRLGSTTNELRGLEIMANRSGIAMNQLEMASQRFRRRTAEAAVGMGEARGALEELGLSAADLIAMSLDEALREVAFAFDDVDNRADKLRLAMKLFDSEGVKLISMFDEIKGATGGAAEEAERMGLAIDELDEQRLIRASQAFTDMGMAAKGMRQEFLIGLGPAMTGFARSVQGAMQSLRRLRGDRDEDEGPLPGMMSDEEVMRIIRRQDALAEAYEAQQEALAKATQDANEAAEKYILAHRTELERLNDEYDMLESWIAAGAENADKLAEHLERISAAILEAEGSGDYLAGIGSHLEDIVDSTGAALTDSMMEIEEIAERVLGYTGAAGATRGQSAFALFARAQARQADETFKSDKARERLLGSIDRKVGEGPDIRVVSIPG